MFRPGSDHPAAVLYDALDYFERKSPKADEAIRSIRPDLARAVDVCTDAAGREWDTAYQQRLLRVSFLSRIQLTYRRRNSGARSWTCTTRTTS